MTAGGEQPGVWGRQKEAWKAKSRAAIVEFIEHFTGRLQCTVRTAPARLHCQPAPPQ